MSLNNSQVARDGDGIKQSVGQDRGNKRKLAQKRNQIRKKGFGLCVTRVWEGGGEAITITFCFYKR